MTAVLATRPASLFDPVDGEATLEEVISVAWEALAAQRVALCPVCGGELTPEYGAHARPLGGRCRDCRSSLR